MLSKTEDGSPLVSGNSRVALKDSVEMELVPRVPDGQVSIEMHLELYVSDLTAIIASAAVGDAREAILEEVLLNIDFLFDSRVYMKLRRLEYDLCQRLCSSLLVLTGQYKEAALLLFKRKAGLSNNAILAFRVLSKFTMAVADFEDALEDQNVSHLRNCLRFDDHIINADDIEHSREALKFLLFMQSHMPKFSDWKVLVDQEDHKTVEKMIKELQESAQDSEKKLWEPSVSRLKRRTHPPKGQFYDQTPTQVVAIFETDSNLGLSSSVVSERRNQYGSNELPSAPPPSLWRMVWHQLTDFIVVVLIVAVIVSLAVEDFKAAIALAVVIIINALIGFTQEYQAEKALQGLSGFSVTMAQVIRDGEQSEIVASDLVPGDVVVLEEGAQVPADLRLIEVSQLFVIESLLTGESEPVSKKTESIRTRKLVPIGDRKNMAFMSTLVSQGRGKGIVVNTGLTTEVGRISSALGGTKDKKQSQQTLLQKKLAKLGKWLVLASILACLVVVLVGLLRKLDDIVQIGISLAVSVIPEGLVVVVTLTLANGTRNMAQKRAIVRVPAVVETLGAVTSICSDKTGTLTLGKMIVSELITDSSRVIFKSLGGDDPYSGDCMVVSKDAKVEQKTLSPQKEVSVLSSLMISALCNNAAIRSIPPEEQKAGESAWEVSGDPTEVALLVGAKKGGAPLTMWESMGFKRLHEFSFTAERKRMSVVTELARSDETIELYNIISENNTSKCILLSKGAIESILPRCDRYIAKGCDDSSSTHSVCSLSGSAIKDIEHYAEELASRGMRVLALALKGMSKTPMEIGVESGLDLSASDDKAKEIEDQLADLFENQMVFVGIVGIIDPPRPEVKDSVSLCRKAGIRVCMITGDHRITASSIAKTLGILPAEGGRVMSGVELTAISSDDLAKFPVFPNVFARVNPDDKLKIVQSLKKRGEIVAMTGDGVNDAPAIKNADVGIAMGISGTEITRQAASVILTDDNFSTIVSAVSEGRRVFDNIQKFLVYLLAVNFSQVVFMLLSISTGFPVPFTALMILWANICVAVPPSLSLGVEPFEANVMTRPPRDPEKGVLSKQKAIILISHVMFLSLIAFTVFSTALRISDKSDEYASSLAFATLYTLHLVHSIMARSVSFSIFNIGLSGNPYLMVGCLVSFGSILMAIYVPGLNDLISLVPIDVADWWRVVVGLVAHIVLVEILKVFVRKFPEESDEFTSNEHKTDGLMEPVQEQFSPVDPTSISV